MSMQSPLSGKGITPSNASAAPRAFLLIFVAVVIGFVVLWKGLDDDLQTTGLDVANSPEQVMQNTQQEPAD